MADDLDPRERIGGNNPPTFAEELESENATLTNEMADLELELRKLPAEVKSDADVQAINSYVTRRRALARKVELQRVATKAPFLEKEKLIDSWFGTIRASLTKTADEIEKRSGPYLLAKQKAEQARREAEAAEAKRKADEARAAAEKAQRDAEEARRRQQEEQERLQKEERERQDKARREQEEAAAAAQKAAAEKAAPQPLPPPPPPPPITEVQQDYQQATVDMSAAQKAADAAAEAARKLENLAARAEKKTGATAGVVGGGGANAKAEMVWVGKVRKWPAVIQSLGPLGSFFSEQTIQDAVDRAAKAKERPTVPGVEFGQELDVKTTATRKG